MIALKYSLVAAISTMAGGLLVVATGRWSMSRRVYMLAFAAGVLLGLTFLKILPEAFAGSEVAPLGVVAGFLLMYFLERFFISHHPHESELEIEGLTMMAWAGLLVHSFVDGLAIASSAPVDSGMVEAITLGVVLHQFPEGLVAAALLLATGFSKVRILVLTFLVAMATPFGAFFSSLALEQLIHTRVEQISLFMMALAGGTFIYVGIADMLHHAHADDKHKTGGVTVAFVGGIGLFVILRWVTGHAH